MQINDLITELTDKQIMNILSKYLRLYRSMSRERAEIMLQELLDEGIIGETEIMIELEDL